MNFIANIDCEYVMRLFSLFFWSLLREKALVDNGMQCSAFPRLQSDIGWKS